MEVILTDTVGFIKNLPKELMVAFRATMEELESADLLLHVIDISNPYYNDHIESVETILVSLKLQHIPVINVLNKNDLVDNKTLRNIRSRLDGIPVSAKSEASLIPLINAMQAAVEKHGSKNIAGDSG
jgi:GTP-binding protein HflX